MDDEGKSVEQALTHILKMQFAQNDLCTAPESYLDNEGIFFIWTTRAYFLFGQGGLIFHLDREGIFSAGDLNRSTLSHRSRSVIRNGQYPRE